MPKRDRIVEPEWLLHQVEVAFMDEYTEVITIAADMYHPALEEYYDVEHELRFDTYRIRRIGDI